MEKLRTDPITLEVIANRLEEIQRVMKHRLFHTGYSTILRESFDGSTGIIDKNGHLIGSSGMSLHATPYSKIVQSVIVKYGDGMIFEGDTFVTNDPYNGGITHVPDMAVATPVFVEGKLLGFCASIAHKPDVGGIVPGSSGSGSRSIFHEGIRLPQVKIYEKGKLNKEVQDILANNSRTPELLIGDLNGQIGCTRIGAQMLVQLCKEYGTETVEDTMEQLMDAAENRMRYEISLLPDGESEAENWLDNDGVTDDPVLIHVKVIKSGDTITFDFSKSNSQVIGPINIRPQVTEAATVSALLSFIDHTIPLNYGVQRAAKLIIPEGTVLHAKYPAPVNHYMPTTHLVYNCVTAALSKFDPRKAIGESGLGLGAISLGFESNRTGDNYVQYEIMMSGLGGTPEHDGASMIFPMMIFTTIQPIEIIEHEFPVRIREFGVRTDSAGAGKSRGGNAYCREYEVLEPCQFTARMAQFRFGSRGVAGGKGPKLGFAVFNPGKEDERYLKQIDTIQMKTGDVIRIEIGGGGGYGNPLEREKELVLADVMDGYVSIEKAKEDYGVVIEVQEDGSRISIS